VGRILERRGVLAAVFVLHAAITLWATLHHEPWRDEADPWLLMRDGDVASILQAASGRGVPLLFELTVWPFARLGAPYLAQQLLNLIYVWMAVALVLRSRAFAAPVKVLFAFSYYPAFEYAAVARPYGLQMLLTFAMAEAWRSRQARPLRLAIVIALLANTTVLGLITAAVAGAILLWERIGWRACVIMLAGGLASVVQLWPREGRQHVYSLVQLDTVWFTVASAFFPDLRVEDAVGPAVVVLGIVFYGISRRWQPVTFLAAVAAGMLGIYLFIWMGGLRHAGLLLVIALAAVWIADAYGPYRRERLLMAALAVSLAYSIMPAYQAWIAETRYAFSGSREAAVYLRGLDEDTVLVSHAPFWNSPLVYLRGRKIWYPAAAEYATHSRWKRSEHELSRISLETALSRAEQQLRGRKWVVVLNRRIAGDRYRLLFETKAPLWRNRDEIYRVYAPAGSP
jgi:hypothetical protein